MGPRTFHLRSHTARFWPRFLKFGGIPPIVAVAMTCIGGTLPAFATSSVARVSERPPVREAACILVIQRSPESTWPDQTTLSALLQSSEVADAPAREVLGMDPESRAQKVRFQISPQDRPGMLTLGLRVTVDVQQKEPVDMARPYLAAVIDRFREAFSYLQEIRTARLETEIRALADEMDGTERDLGKVRASLGALDEKSGMHFPTAMDLRVEPRGIQNQISNIMLYLDGSRRQSDAAGNSRDEESRRLAVEAWRQVVTLLEERLQDLRRLASEGKADPVEVAEFEVRLAEARAHAVTLEKPPVGQIMAGRQRDPGEIERTAAEKERELERLLERLRDVEKLDLRRMASEMEDLEKEERRLLERRDTMATQLRKLKQELTDLSRLSVEVIGK